MTNTVPKVVAIDFDGVIHDYKHPVPGKTMGPPVAGALEGVVALIKEGYKVVVFTVRANRPVHVADWLHFYGFPPLDITNVKSDFFCIVDDRARRFSGWPLTLN